MTVQHFGGLVGCLLDLVLMSIWRRVTKANYISSLLACRLQCFSSVYEECLTSFSDGVPTSVQLFERYKDQVILRVTSSQEVS